MKVIAIDFDGVIYFKKHIEKVNTAREKIWKLFDNRDNFIVIYTARPEIYRKEIEKFLRDNNVPYHALVTGKIRADVYIDDKSRRKL